MIIIDCLDYLYSFVDWFYMYPIGRNAWTDIILECMSCHCFVHLDKKDMMLLINFDVTSFWMNNRCCDFHSNVSKPNYLKTYSLYCIYYHLNFVLTIIILCWSFVPIFKCPHSHRRSCDNWILQIYLKWVLISSLTGTLPYDFEELRHGSAVAPGTRAGQVCAHGSSRLISFPDS